MATQPVLGFRFGKAAYLTDFSSVPDSSKALLGGLDDFILDALRYVPHPTHSNVEQSLALVEELKPKRAWFTHICHDLGHDESECEACRRTCGSRTTACNLRCRALMALAVVHSAEEWMERFGETAQSVRS